MTRQDALRHLRSRTFLRQCVQDGMTIREIADALGVGRTNVRHWMRHHGVTPVRRHAG
jgi:phage antirepressor YoqD-like protein